MNEFYRVLENVSTFGDIGGVVSQSTWFVLDGGWYTVNFYRMNYARSKAGADKYLVSRTIHKSTILNVV